MEEEFRRWAESVVKTQKPGVEIAYKGQIFRVDVREDGSRYLLMPPGFFRLMTEAA